MVLVISDGLAINPASDLFREWNQVFSYIARATNINPEIEAQTYDLSVNGEWVRRRVRFAARADTMHRLVFRTGPWRGEVDSTIVDRGPATRGLDREDLGGAGQPAALSMFLVDDVKTE